MFDVDISCSVCVCVRVCFRMTLQTERYQQNPQSTNKPTIGKEAMNFRSEAIASSMPVALVLERRRLTAPHTWVDCGDPNLGQ